MKKAKNAQKRSKNVIFQLFKPFSKFHPPAWATLTMTLEIVQKLKNMSSTHRVVYEQGIPDILAYSVYSSGLNENIQTWQSLYLSVSMGSQILF